MILRNNLHGLAQSDDLLVRQSQARVDEALSDPHTAEAEQFLKKEIEDLRSNLSGQKQSDSAPDAQARYEMRRLEAQMQAQLMELERQYLRQRAQSAAGASDAPEESGIVFSGLSAAAEANLRARLPVQVGDRLSGKALRDSYSVVSVFDQRLELTVFMVGEGRAEIRISK
jgi:hypothetical protein